MSTDNELPDPFDPSTLFVAHPLERGGALPPLNAPAGTSGFTAAVSDQPADWSHTITLKVDHFVDGERQRVLKEYRWRFEAGVDAHDQPRIVAQHRRLPAGGWSEVRSPDRLAQLRALASPV